MGRLAFALANLIAFLCLLLVAAFPNVAWPNPMPTDTPILRIVPSSPPRPCPTAHLCVDATPSPSPRPTATPHRFGCISDAFDADLGPIACWDLKPSPRPKPSPAPYAIICDEPGDRRCKVYALRQGRYVLIASPTPVPGLHP